MLDAWLEYHRATLAWKCEGLDRRPAARALGAAVELSLLGLVRHMADVERNWFRLRGSRGEDAPGSFWTPTTTTATSTTSTTPTSTEAFDDWRDECEQRARGRGRFASLDDVGTGRPTAPASRCAGCYVHMIEEYARHNGHADLLRERIDGATGD